MSDRMYPDLPVIPKEHSHGIPQVFEENQPDRFGKSLLHAGHTCHHAVVEGIHIGEGETQQGQEDDQRSTNQQDQSLEGLLANPL